jgi:hypothetical protein
VLSSSTRSMGQTEEAEVAEVLGARRLRLASPLQHAHLAQTYTSPDGFHTADMRCEVPPPPPPPP